MWINLLNVIVLSALNVHNGYNNHEKIYSKYFKWWDNYKESQSLYIIKLSLTGADLVLCVMFFIPLSILFWV